MKKTNFVIRTSNGFQNVEGYITNDSMHGIDKRNNAWYLTELATGYSFDSTAYKSRKDAFVDIERVENVVNARGLRDSENYKKAVEELKKFKGVDTESEGKEMAKTNTKAKAKADTNNKALEKENKALKKELEILKKQIEELTRVEKTTIDTFDVEGYLASRDNSARITAELVEALENTEGLTVTRKGKDGWVYVSGKTEDDTRNRKDIFKAMGFRFSANEKAWFLAPYPLRSAKAWGAKKARATA